ATVESNDERSRHWPALAMQVPHEQFHMAWHATRGMAVSRDREYEYGRLRSPEAIVRSSAERDRDVTNTVWLQAGCRCLRVSWSMAADLPVGD
ncbi:hypothetical protein T310_8457, partial [Rasamsonia emersonii CBS 393.64]